MPRVLTIGMSNTQQKGNTMEDTKLWDRLVTVQNRIALEYGVPVDILTITGFMNAAEKEAHCARYEKDYPAK